VSQRKYKIRYLVEHFPDGIEPEPSRRVEPGLRVSERYGYTDEILVGSTLHLENGSTDSMFIGIRANGETLDAAGLWTRWATLTAMLAEALPPSSPQGALCRVTTDEIRRIMGLPEQSKVRG